jgi:hypothetical protein
MKMNFYGMCLKCFSCIVELVRWGFNSLVGLDLDFFLEGALRAFFECIWGDFIGECFGNFDAFLLVGRRVSWIKKLLFSSWAYSRNLHWSPKSQKMW